MSTPLKSALLMQLRRAFPFKKVTYWPASVIICHLKKAATLLLIIFSSVDLWAGGPSSAPSKIFTNPKTTVIHQENKLPGQPLGQILYVTQYGAGLKNGTSWANAYSDFELHSALLNAGSGTEFWIAAGTYRPTNNGSGTYRLKSGVKVYGGFAGTETQLNQRNPVANVTWLKGSAYQLMYVLDITEPTLLDGVIMTTQATQITTFGQVGGALWVSGGNDLLTVNNVTFRDNLAGKGAGIYILHSSPKITNCTFTNNIASANAVRGAVGAGGAIAIDCARANTTAYGSHGRSDPTISNCKFSGNSAGYGSAIYVSSDDIYNNSGNLTDTYTCNPVITNCLFEKNLGVSTIHIGAYSNSGILICAPTIQKSVFLQNQGNSIYNYSAGLSLITNIWNCVFTGGNQPAIANGAVSNSGVTSNACTPIILNCTIYGQPALSNLRSSPVLKNVIIWGYNSAITNFEQSFPQITNSIIKGGHPGAGNIDTDPVFVNPSNLIGPDNQWGTADDGLMLLPCSSAAINAGVTTYGGPTSDIRGVAWYGNPDIGAYEQTSTRLTPVIAITTDSKTVCAGTSVRFTAATRYGGNSPAFQWKKDGVNVGTNSRTYVDSTIKNNDIITCVLTSSDACSSGEVTSNSLLMTVNQIIKPGITITTQTPSVCPGSQVTFTATPVNPGDYPYYQWQRNGKNVGSNSPAYTAAFVTADTIRCILSTSTDCTLPRSATSNTIVVKIKPQQQPAATIKASATSIIPKMPVTFTAKVVNGGIKPVYSWFKNGIEVGQNLSTYTDSLLKGNEQIACVITSSSECPLTDTSNVITIKMAAPQLSSFSPTQAIAGSTVVIKGKYLTNASSVNFGGRSAASFIVDSDSQISAVVGDGASGDISVTTPGGEKPIAGFTYLLTQKINFPVITAKTTNALDFNPGATSSSGLPVLYTLSNTKVATIVDGKIHIIAKGTVTVIAKQPGDGSYAPAVASQLLTVTAPETQVITFDIPPALYYGSPDFDPGASSSAGLPISYISNDTTVIKIVNNKLHLIGVGKVTITATQPGNEVYNKATSISRTLTIKKGDQTINFNPLDRIVIGSSAYITAVANSSSGLPIQFVSSDTLIAKISRGLIFPYKAGVVNITAVQQGNSFYNAAPPVTQALNISKNSQYISVPYYSNKSFGMPDFDPGAYVSSGLQPVYASSDTNIVTVTKAGLLHLKGLGTVTISVTQPGNDNYFPANMVVQMLTISKGMQAINFLEMPPVKFGAADFIPAASSSSGLPLTFTSGDTSKAKVINGRIHVLKVGTVNISAYQAGNNNYQAATKIVRALTILKGDQTIAFAPIHAKNFGDGSFSVDAIVNSGLKISFSSSDTTIAKISSTGIITIRQPGTVTITANQQGSSAYLAASPVSQKLVIGKGNQSITFSTPYTRTYGTVDFSLTATASSKLPVSYKSSDTTIASILAPNKVHIKKAGTVIITATQEGNTFYNAAMVVNQTVNIEKAAQTISFAPLSAKTYGSAKFLLTATSSSKLPVSYKSSNTAVATITKDTVYVKGAGTTVITASQSGNANYTPAETIQQTLIVNRASQVLTLNIPEKTFGSADFTLKATSTSGLPVGLSSNDSTKVTISNKGLVHILNAGSITITAYQPGNANYNAASTIKKWTILKKAQAITFSAIPAKRYGDLPFDGGAVAGSGLKVSYTSSDTTVAKTSSTGLLTIRKPGTVTITANQSGSNNYLAAAPVSQRLVISKGNQVISFDTLAPLSFGVSDFKLTATASSKLPISYKSSDTTIASILLPNKVHIKKAGTVTITASQTGNEFYNAATAIKRKLIISKKMQTISFASLSAKTYGAADFLLTASASSKLPVSYLSSNAAVATILNGKVHINGAGTTIITASQAGDGNFSAATAVQQTLTVNKAAQTITLDTLANQTYGAPDRLLKGSASSGLAINYTTSNAAVALVTNGILHVVGAGSAVITANQAGNANYNAASAKTIKLTVAKAPLTITADNKTKTAGSVNPTLTVTYSGFVNGDTEKALTVLPSLATTATTTSAAGSYIITVKNAAAANYTIKYVYGTLTVTTVKLHSAANYVTETNSDVRTNTTSDMPQPLVHSSLSPNGDGVNDLLLIDNVADYPVNTLRLINLNGSEIFSISNYNNADRVFDGHSSAGRLQEAGTYFYLFEYKDKDRVIRKTGYIVLKR